MKTRKTQWCLIICISLVVLSCNSGQKEATMLPNLPDGVQAISLLGDTLHSSTPFEGGDLVEKYEKAKQDYDSNPNNADIIIWYGRRTAYLGRHRDAIKIYTKGIQKFPEDARMYRHRGHRYITVREFDRSIKDFEHAAILIKDTEDIIEPDGMPNAQNIPVSSLHQNIWYHLGLAYYLKNDMENALRIYKEGIKSSTNDDMLSATTHWLYMTLRRLGKEDEAKKALEPINAAMDIIENMAYHNLCLFYKGELSLEKLTGGDFTSIMNAAAAYGVGNWYFYNGDREKAKEIFNQILGQKGWGSFGYIAAEADFSREFKNITTSMK